METIKKIFKWIKDHLFIVGAAIGSFATIILQHILFSGRNRTEAGRIGDTAESIADSVGECESTSSGLTGAIDSCAAAVEDVGDSIEAATTATGNAQDTINDIRQLIEAERARIEKSPDSD